jgi:Na+/proline symporter
LSGLLVALVVAQAAVACPVCFGSPDSPMTKGASAGIWVLLGVIGFVQLGFVALFVTFWKRARDLRKRKEQFHLIHGGVH